MTEVKAIRVRKLSESSFMFQAGQFCCGFKNIWIRVDVEIFVSGKGKLRVQIIRIRINRAYAINHNDDDENDRKPKLVFK